MVVVQPGTAPRFQLSPAAVAAGLEVAPLAEAGAQLSRLGRLVSPGHGLFEALNATAWSSGALIRVPRRAVVPGPIEIVTRLGGSAAVRNLVVLEERAQATVVETQQGGDAASRQTAVTEVFVGREARLRHVLAQRWGEQVAGHWTHRALLDADADLLTFVLMLGGALAKLDLGALLAGAGARSELRGVILGAERQTADLHTLHDHKAPHTWSNIDLKVALGGRATSTYTGLIKIREDAAGSEAYQENRNLLLSGQARAHTIPELEILTDDVACTHGATVAPVDDAALFYLRSRGLTPDRALALVVQGFLTSTLRGLTEDLAAVLDATLQARLPALTRVTS